MHPFTVLFLAALLASVTLRLYLAYRQIRCVRDHRDTVPPAFADVIPSATHRQAADYAAARTRLGMIDTGIEAGLLLIWTLGGGLAALDALWRGLALSPVVTGVGVLASVAAVGALIDLPLRIHRTFGIEQRFGFNRTTPGLFAADQLKSMGLLLLLGVPLAAIVLALMQAAGPAWWLYAWAVWLGFNLVMVWAWPAFIAPWFNRFTPLADGNLRARIDGLLARCGFASNGVFIIDGSRRSGHGNAYFSGLGRNKRIVFFDTLLEQLDGDQVEAVLAHELGHFHHRHVARNIGGLALASLAGLGLLAWLMQQAWFYTALGVPVASTHMALVLFVLLLPVFSVFLQPLFAWCSRRHEFQADTFAARHSSAQHLVEALLALYRENAGTLTPDPWWSAFHDSHPPAAERIAHLRHHGAVTL